MGKSKQISILISEELLADIDGMATRLGRSRNWVISGRLEQWANAMSGKILVEEPGAKSAQEVMVPRKKIANISVGGGAQEGGGTPDLSPLGKAQDGDLVETIVGIDLSVGQEPVIHTEMRPRKNSPANGIRREAQDGRYDKNFGDDRICGCGHVYYRHFDSYEDMAPVGCKYCPCGEWHEKEGEEEPFLYGRPGVAPDFNEVIIPRQAKIIPAEDGADYFVAPRSSLPDGVPCSHAGCLSHVSHPCEGCGRIGGRAAGEALKFPQWSEERLRELADAEPGGLMACSPEILGHLLEDAKTDAATATKLHLAGVELDREILVRWGLAENYKPKMEEKSDGEGNHPAGRGKARKGRGTVGGDSKADAEGVDGGKGDAMANGKPGVEMQALRDICEGKGIRPAPLSVEPVEVDLCGFKSYNEIDGENYVCGKEVHGPKIKHGDWLKI